MLMLRIELPDRPGALGQVARAIGQVGCDINSIQSELHRLRHLALLSQ